MFLSPLGERLGEGVQQKAAFCITPSPNLSPKGERSHEGLALSAYTLIASAGPCKGLHSAQIPPPGQY
jgi:hypothetical protein